MIKSKKISYLIISLIIIFGVVIDLITKSFFENYYLEKGEDIEVINDFFKFTFVKNTGAAYGMFSNSTVLLSIISIAMIVGFIVYDIFCHSNNIFYVLGFSFIISGAIGNLVDRMVLGYVRDFISLRIFNFIFNIADIFVCVGMALFITYLVITMIKQEKEKKKGNTDALEK